VISYNPRGVGGASHRYKSRKGGGPDVPFLLKELLEVEVAEGGGCVGPGPAESGAVSVAATQAVCTTEGHNLSVVEAHAVEHVAQMLGPLDDTQGGV